MSVESLTKRMGTIERATVTPNAMTTAISNKQAKRNRRLERLERRFQRFSRSEAPTVAHGAPRRSGGILARSSGIVARIAGALFPMPPRSLHADSICGEPSCTVCGKHYGTRGDK